MHMWACKSSLYKLTKNILSLLAIKLETVDIITISNALNQYKSQVMDIDIREVISDYLLIHYHFKGILLGIRFCCCSISRLFTSCNMYLYLWCECFNNWMLIF